MKSTLRALLLPINPLESYVEKGTIGQYREYFNPAEVFERYIVLYPDRAEGSGKLHGVTTVRIAKKNPLSDFVRLFAMAIALVRRGRIDVVRTYTATLEGLLAVLVGKFCRIPSVVSLHTIEDDLIRTRRFSVHIRLAVWIVVTLVLSLADNVWCVSEGVRDYVLSRGARKDRVRVIYNKVKVDRFLGCESMRRQARSELGYSREDFVIVHVGRLSLDKRLHIIVGGLAELKARGVTNVKLLLVGGISGKGTRGVMLKGGTTVYTRDRLSFAEISSQIERHDLSGDVVVTGFQPHERIPYYLSAADAYVIAMTIVGFGFSIAEASAAGLPIIATRKFQRDDHGLLVNPRTSIVFDADDPSDLAKRILQLKEDSHLRKTLGMNARENSKLFRWDVIAEREAGYYLDLFGSEPLATQ